MADVQHTAFNETELLNLDVNQISTNDLIWIAKKDNNDWDVQRICNTGLRVVAVRSINNASQLEVAFTGTHSFQQNDYFAISNSQYPNLNGVYQVFSSSSDKTIIFDYNRALLS